MAQPQTYRFCFGPWNLSEGADPYGPTTRPPQSFDWKLAQLKKHGFAAMMFHDDDAVPDIDGKSEAQIRKEAAELRKRLDGEGVAAEMVAPRLWFSPMTIDGAYTSNDPKHRQYAIDRSLRSIDIAKILGTDILVLWLAREGSYIRESKNARRCVALLVEAFDKMLAHDKKIRLAIEPKPNEPMEHAYLPTIGHALAIAQLTRDPERVGCLIESAHAILAGLDPADEIDFAMSFGKLGAMASTSASMSTPFAPPGRSIGWIICSTAGAPFCGWSIRPALSTKRRRINSSPTATTRPSTKW